MAMPRKIKVEFGEAFAFGALVVGEPQPLRDFEKSTREKPVQAVDEESGHLMWTVDVLDADPEVNKSGRSFGVKLVSQYQPVLPEAADGTPAYLAFMRPVEFVGLTASPYVADSPMGNGKGKLAWSFRATGMHAPQAQDTGNGAAQAAASANGRGKQQGPSAASGEKAAA